MQAYEYVQEDPWSLGVLYANRMYFIDVGMRSWVFTAVDPDGCVVALRMGSHADANLRILEAPDRHFLNVSVCPDVWFRVDARTDRVTFRFPDGGYAWP